MIARWATGLAGIWAGAVLLTGCATNRAAPEPATGYQGDLPHTDAPGKKNAAELQADVPHEDAPGKRDATDFASPTLPKLPISLDDNGRVKDASEFDLFGDKGASTEDKQEWPTSASSPKRTKKPAPASANGAAPSKKKSPKK